LGKFCVTLIHRSRKQLTISMASRLRDYIRSVANL
jgi:hypothetical protein